MTLIEFCECLLFTLFKAINYAKNTNRKHPKKVKKDCTNKLVLCQEVSCVQYFGLPVYPHSHCECIIRCIGFSF